MTIRVIASSGFVEAETLVESLGLLEQGMHDHAADADGVGRTDDAQRGIPKQGAAKPLAMMWGFHRQSAQHNDRHGSGMLRRKRPGAAAEATALDARA